PRSAAADDEDIVLKNFHEDDSLPRFQKDDSPPSRQTGYHILKRPCGAAQDMDLINSFMAGSTMAALFALGAFAMWLSGWRVREQHRARDILRQLPRHEPAPLIDVLKLEARKYRIRR